MTDVDTTTLQDTYVLTYNEASNNFIFAAPSAGSEPTYTNPNPSVIAVGGIAAGTTFNNTTFAEFVDNLLYPELFPTLTAPTSVFTSNISGLREIGSISDITFTATFNRGSISPQYTSDTPYRSGNPNFYNYTGSSLTDTTTSSLSNVQTIPNYVVVKGTQIWYMSVSYDAGPQPKGSKGSDYQTALPAGTIPDKTRTIVGVYPYFSTTVDMFTMTKQPLANFNSNVTVTFAKETGDGNKQSIEFPFDDWRAITKIEQFNNFTNAYEVIPLDSFTVSEVFKDVNGASIKYRKYTYNSITIGSRLTRWTA